MCERERKQQEQILYLLNVKDKCEQLETINRELELEKNRLEEELNKKNGELDEEKRRECVGLLEKLNDLSSRKDVVKRKNGELELEKNRLEKELNDSMAVCNDLKDHNAHLQALMCEREKVALNKINDLCQEIQNLKREKAHLNRTDSEDVAFSEKHVSDSDEENNSRNEKEEIRIETGNEGEEIMNETREKNEESMSERSSRKEGIQRQASVDLEDEALPAVGGDYSIPIDIESDSLIVISDSEDNSGSDDDSPPNCRLERPLSDLKCDERLISCKKEFPLSSTSKRKWGAETGTSVIKTEDEDERKKLDAGKNVLLELFSMEMQTPSLSPPSRNIE
ncbi:hypothetical protein MKX03_014237, partial [Papaver bracteatum]